MNDDRSLPQPPPLPTTEPMPDIHYEGNALGALLKAPFWLVNKISRRENLVAHSLELLLWGLVLHALFGVSIGVFSGWEVAGMAAVKVPLIAGAALLICLPSMYVLASVGGMAVNFEQVLAVGACVVSGTGLMLLGLAPVAWLFAVSTESRAFVVVLDLIIWAISAVFAFQIFSKLSVAPALRRTGGLRFWTVIYVLVMLQMATTLRPIISKPTAGWWPGEKKFFLVHFAESMEPAKKAPGKK
jgi:hypothetical protein